MKMKRQIIKTFIKVLIKY